MSRFVKDIIMAMVLTIIAITGLVLTMGVDGVMARLNEALPTPLRDPVPARTETITVGDITLTCEGGHAWVQVDNTRISC